MLTKKQLSEIKNHLEKAQNPIFFFDNDADGLCSFLLLQRFIERGKGVPVRSFPEMSKDYFRKIQELNADYIFILDKPMVSREFFEEAEKINIPVVWIDHHDINSFIPKFVNYYNPNKNKKKSSEPTTFLCWQVVSKNRKEDLWFAVVGCVADSFMPKFYNDFLKKHPELGFKTKNAFDVFYKTQIGKVARIFGFALKDSTTNVITMLKFLMKSKSPYDVLEENNKNATMHDRFDQIEKRYKKLLEKAEEVYTENKILFFQYSGDLSISSDLANELMYKFPDKIIVVVYLTGIKANVSVRGKKVKYLVLKAIKDLEGATGGGHEDAVGAKVSVDDLEVFRNRLEEFSK